MPKKTYVCRVEKIMFFGYYKFVETYKIYSHYPTKRCFVSRNLAYAVIGGCFYAAVSFMHFSLLLFQQGQVKEEKASS